MKPVMRLTIITAAFALGSIFWPARGARVGRRTVVCDHGGRRR